MAEGKVLLKQPDRFADKYVIPREKLEHALQVAVEKLEWQLDKYGDVFFDMSATNYQYQHTSNNNWVCGMLTGTYMLAYQLTGKERFLEVVKHHIDTYQERLDNKVGMQDHDVGFAFSPSCVAAYQVLGIEQARQIALEAADYYYNLSYSKKGGFIIRDARRVQEEAGCRTMMDTLMNITLLFWAGKETGRKEYTDAAISQCRITEKYLIREDGSSYHHYQFHPDTHKPVRGLTWQGYSDDSCWSRGQAWGIWGFPIAYSETGDESLKELHKKVTYYMLNHLPKDCIPKWDLDFIEEDQPRDSSAGAISICGMLEMCKHLSDNSEMKTVYESAAAQMMEALIDRCTGEMGVEYDGLIYHVTAALPQNRGIDQTAVYGDYFYMEALVRYLRPEWKCFWL